MSDNRETPAVGAPVEESEASHTEILEAVERAKNTGDGSKTESADQTAGSEAQPEAAESNTGGETGIAQEVSGAEGTKAKSNNDGTSSSEQQHREEVAQLDTEMDIETPAQPKSARPQIATTDEMPSAAAEPTEAAMLPALGDSQVRDGEIRVSADHPMAALYTQTPAPPEIRGNRGAGILISLLATLGFAVVYAGVLALWIAPDFPPSTFLNEGLLPLVVSLSFGVTVAGFFIAMTILVLIVGRAGWWAYVLGGFFVALAVWASAALGGALHDRFMLGESVSFTPLNLFEEYGLIIPVLAAAIVAREAAVWFGAWIGARGRKMKLQNAEALAEYELAMAEVQAKPL